MAPLLVRDSFTSSFPSLVGCEWSITAPKTQTYNCIAWSVGETDAWYNKLDMDEVGNNNGVFEDSDVVAFYTSKGYIQTTSNIGNGNVLFKLPWSQKERVFVRRWTMGNVGK